MLGFWLKQEGFIEYTAASAEEALQLLAHIDPDLVVSDVRLPGVDGVELVSRIKTQRDVPALLMSGYPEPQFHHADRFFLKPYGLDAMIDFIKQLRPQLLRRAGNRSQAMH